MKSLKTIILAIVASAAMVSCGATNDPYGNRYPGNDRVIVYRAPDGGTYRTGEVYRDRSGNVYQNGRIIRTGGNVYNGRNLPPGQAKKVYGGEAKDYAPGQVKKRGPYYDKRYDDNDYKKHKNHKGNKGKGRK